MLNKNIEIAGQVLHLLLDEIGKMLKPGITGNDINSFAEDCINNYGNGCTLACKGYQCFPASLCVSINEGIIHGIPSNKTGINFTATEIVADNYNLEFNFQGPALSWPVVYACWLENENGENIQNIYWSIKRFSQFF